MPTTMPIVTAITGYVQDHQDLLVSKAILNAKSAGLFNLMSGVKGDTNLNIMNTDVVFGDGSSCGWDETGSTEFSKRVLKPAYLKINQAFCDKKMLKTYAQHLVKVAAGQKSLPFEEEWTADIVAKVNAGIEKMIYRGQSGSTTEFEGLVSILDGEADVVSASAASGTSAYAFLKGVAAAIPAEVKDPVILVGTSLYREFMQDLVAANLFHYDPANGANEYRLPGTDIRVIAVDGLIPESGDTYDYAIAANLDNLVYGCDMEGDEDKFDLWYSKDNQEFRLAIEFIAGVQVAFPAEIVLGKRAR